MHISFSVDTNTLTPEQHRGLAILLTGIAVPDPCQVGPTPGEPEQATIKRSEVRLKAGDVVKIPRCLDEVFEVEVRENRTYPNCIYWAGWSSFTGRGRFHPEHPSPHNDITEVNGLKIIEDTP